MVCPKCEKYTPTEGGRSMSCPHCVREKEAQRMAGSWKKTFTAEMVELGDSDEGMGAPSALFQRQGDEGRAFLTRIEMEPEDLREIATAFYDHVTITIEYKGNDQSTKAE